MILSMALEGDMVASRADAWIETEGIEMYEVQQGSRPARTRGLKPGLADRLKGLAAVASRADAWIETRWMAAEKCIQESRPARTRGLKHWSRLHVTLTSQSRPARTRGLKPGLLPRSDLSRLARAARARGLKRSGGSRYVLVSCRVPRGRVD